MAETQSSTVEVEEKPLNKTKDLKKYKDKNFTEKLWHIRDNITVEPILAGLIIPSVISRFAMGNFNLDKACRVHYEFPDEVCKALISKTSNNYTEYENTVQKLISSIDIWKSIIHTAIPCIIIMFLGAWSDRTGKRKLILMLPIFGELLTSINNVINVYFFYEIPVRVTVFLETIFSALTGGWVVMFLGVFSYISDITSEQSRTFRVGLVNFCMTAGVPIGIGVSGILIKKVGYYAIFSTTTGLFLVVLLYGCFCLKEPDDWLRDKGLPVINRSDGKDVSFFDVNHVLNTIGVAFRERPSNRRAKVILTLLAVFILYGPAMSEHIVYYLFVRNQLSWDMVKFSVYTSYSIVLHSLGAMFCITILSKKLQIDDSLLCLISMASKFGGSIWIAFVKTDLEMYLRAMFCITILSKKLQIDDSLLCLISMASKFGGSIWIAFVKTDLEMYLIPIAELLSGTTFTSLRSIISKLVEKQETAKVNSLFSLTETLASLVFQPFYSWLYMNTLQVLPGAVFLTSAAFIIPASFILILFYIQFRKELESARKKAFEKEEKKEAEIEIPKTSSRHVT